MALAPRLVDTRTKTVHELSTDAKYLLASHSHLFPPSLDTQAASLSPPVPLLLPPPLTHNEQYCVQLEVDSKGRAMVSVWVGDCSVDHQTIQTKCTAIPLSHESQLQLGHDLVLQYSSGPAVPRRRLLPQTPGQQRSEAPPSKPSRTQPAVQPLPEMAEATGNRENHSLSLEESLEPRLRERLKRIAREVNSRESKAIQGKPPPPYEQVGNSIGYQLLLQHHGSQSDVTALMIDSLYPMLKYMQLKEQSLEQFYKEYLEQYSTARRGGATPTNMHPEDTPTIVFIVDTLIQLCSLPRVNELAVRYCPLWMKLLSIFCQSPRNQLAMATKRLATKVVSCMGLGIMAEQPEFQMHGWSVLTQVVGIPTPSGSKPALPEPAIALALPLVERQLQAYGDHLPLAIAILEFLSRLASTAKQRVELSGDGSEKNEEEEKVYTPEQASRVLELLSGHSVLRHVMKVPQQVRKNPTFDMHYCVLVKALVPTRRKVATKPPSLTPSSHSTTSLAPPAKPKRIRRAVTEASLMGSRKSRKSQKSYKSRAGENEQGKTANSNSGTDLIRSLSEEKLTECEGVEGEGEEVSVVRSEGEEDSDVEEAGKLLEEMKAQKEKAGANAEVHHETEAIKEKVGEGQPTGKSDGVACSQPASEAPLSPDSLAGDIASALAEVRQPVRQFSLKRNTGQPAVHVPDIPAHNSYYRTSMKRKAPGSGAVNEMQGESSVQEQASLQTQPAAGRVFWAPVSPPALPLEGTELLEASVDLLPSEVECGHRDVCVALSERLQLLQGVWGLWRGGRGLQAATNCVRGCFSEGIYDTALFCDLLRCFTSFESPWTLAVAVVLLPVIAKLLGSLREPAQLTVLAAVADMVVKRFSPSILSCKKGNKSRRISSTADLQQKRLCYNELHNAWVAIGQRPKSGRIADDKEVVNLLSDLQKTLSPFRNELPAT